MLDLHSRLRRLTRPALLTRAARMGVDHYRRDWHLPRLLNRADTPCPADATMQLLMLEEELNTARRTRAAEYSFDRHIDVLIALMCEARTVQNTTRAKAVS
ncbi:MAG: DUF6477 family protein [Paracoccaceae bacterium]